MTFEIATLSFPVAAGRVRAKKRQDPKLVAALLLHPDVFLDRDSRKTEPLRVGPLSASHPETDWLNQYLGWHTGTDHSQYFSLYFLCKFSKELQVLRGALFQYRLIFFSLFP